MRVFRKSSLIFACIIASLSVIFFGIVSNSKSSPEFKSRLDGGFPKFSTVDKFGYEIESASLFGNKIFVQFLNPTASDQVEALKNVSPVLISKKIPILVFLKDCEIQILDDFMDEIRPLLGYITLIDEDYTKFKNLFNLPGCCESFFLFDESGNVLISDSNHLLNNKRALHYVNESVNSPYFKRIFVSEGQDLSKRIEFRQLFDLLDKEHKYFVYTFYSRHCSECRSGQILREIIRFHKKYREKIGFFAILSDDYSDNDVSNFKKILKIEFEVHKASRGLLSVWIRQRTIVGDLRENNIVFVADKEGKVLRLLMMTQAKKYFQFLDKIADSL